LATLNERARMLSGTLKIQSQPGSGTRLTCTIPVDRKARATGN
jgi:signal transduction histidine kinase